MKHARRRAGSHRFRQLAATANPAHQRHPSARAVGGVPGDRDHQFGDHPHPVGRAGEIHLPHHRRALPHPIRRGVPGVRGRDLGVAVHDLDRSDHLPAMETACSLRGRCADRLSRAVDHGQAPLGTPMALRPLRSPAHGVVPIPRRPALDRHARRGAHRVGPLATRTLATLVVDAAAGVHTDPSGGQRDRAGALTCWGWPSDGSSARW